MESKRLPGILTLGKITTTCTEHVMFDSSRGHTGKTKTRFFKNRVFVLETELLQFRAYVPSGDMFFSLSKEKNGRARGESS
jgi:hypothetical protein